MCSIVNWRASKVSQINLSLRQNSEYCCVLWIGCGAVVNNSLKSPGFPNKYPSRMDCIYLVPIPKDMTMKVIFEKFSMEYTDKDCRWEIQVMQRDPFLVIQPYTSCCRPSYHVTVYEPNLPLLWGIGCPLWYGRSRGGALGARAHTYI